VNSNIFAENWQKSTKISKNRRKSAKIDENWRKFGENRRKFGENRRKLMKNRRKIVENRRKNGYHNIDPSLKSSERLISLNDKCLRNDTLKEARFSPRPQTTTPPLTLAPPTQQHQYKFLGAKPAERRRDLWSWIFFRKTT
jgi:hypothetical protein